MIFSDDRKARVRYGAALGPSFDLCCSVPQGSVLSPTLFIIYTNDTPPPVRGTNISYADDVTQIAGDPGKSLTKRETISSINTLSQFESKWKIKTNPNKFSILRLWAKKKLEDIIMDIDIYTTQHTGKILGIHITKYGYIQHITQRKNIVLNTLKCIIQIL